MEIRISVIGLGYVGLPLALAFARKFPGTVGFDIDREKIEAIKRGEDPTHEGNEGEIERSALNYTASPEELRICNFFVVGVPTPVDENHNPDLTPLRKACSTVGKALKKGDIVVFESTVYPGVTEEVCGPLLAEVSGLVQGKDFKLGYSPERINPGDKNRTLERIVKVVSGEDEATLDIIAAVYSKIIDAGVYRANSIKVAEAAKVIENTQRDLNIALMNELAMIFDRMNIRTRDVLAAAETKWNFVKFHPGLVGGHCIGVDPYYLTTKAEQLGYHPQVILAGRRINDDMGIFVAQRMIKMMVNAGIQMKGARVGVLGITFKENVTDIRNSRVPDIIRELQQFGVETVVHDPLVNAEEVMEEYGITLQPLEALTDLEGVVFAVPHQKFIQMGEEALLKLVKKGGVFVDVKSAISSNAARENLVYWSL
jgi:UDP-N-acetyl-D-galactosamine dehydrogenase